MMFGFAWLGLLLLLAGLFAASVRILREYERGVVFTLGRFWKVKGPGLLLLLPAIQQMVKGSTYAPSFSRCRRRT